MHHTGNTLICKVAYSCRSSAEIDIHVVEIFGGCHLYKYSVLMIDIHSTRHFWCSAPHVAIRKSENALQRVYRVQTLKDINYNEIYLIYDISNFLIFLSL